MKTDQSQVTPVQKFGVRVLCEGGCGTWVLPRLGIECRKCRRKRIHAGLKKIKKLEKAEKAVRS